MHKAEFATRIILLALGWALVMARIAGPGVDAGTLRAAGFLLAVTLSLALVRSIPDPPSGEDTPDPDTLPWTERLVAALPGKIAIVLAALLLAIGTGSIVGTLLCVPVLGPAEMVSALPGVLGKATLGAALSLIGFGLFGFVLAMLGPILSSVFESWTMYIAPVIGGIAGAALESGPIRGGPIGEVLESGPIASGILLVGLSALVGSVASTILEGTRGKGKPSVKSLGENLIAGIGIGAINGIILALLFRAVGAWR
jgi:hypothetical protein